MAINIAAMSDTEKLAYAQATGSVRLSSHVISVPVPYIDLILPADYLYFEASWIGMVFDNGAGGIGGAFSSDAGVTFYNASGSYLDNSFGYAQDQARTTVGTDQLMDFDISSGPDNGMAFHLFQEIWPGGVDQNAVVLTRGTYALSASESGRTTFIGTTVLFEATGRQNVMRLMPWGNGDIPPTSGINIVAGTCILKGMA